MINDADFTPDIERAVWIRGPIDQAMLDRLRPEILELTALNRDPITMYLDTGGGDPDAGEAILRLLRRTTQDDARVSRIITVAAPRAHSMGACLLSAGDFATAYQSSTLLWHGGRWPLSDLVSAGEAGRLYALTLPIFHEKNAAVLAQRSVRRFLFIVDTYRATFAEHRARAGDPTLTDLEVFQSILRAQLSPTGQKVLERAIPLADSRNGLLLHFQKRLPRGRTVTTEHLRKLMRYSAFDFEHEKGERPDWYAVSGRIDDHFHFLNSYFDFGALCDYVASRASPQTAGMDVEADYILQFRFFFLALCRALQEGENDITPFDAVMLGLIDTVRQEPAAANENS